MGMARTSGCATYPDTRGVYNITQGTNAPWATDRAAPPGFTRIYSADGRYCRDVPVRIDTPPRSLERIVVDACATSERQREARQREVARRNEYVKQKLRDALGPRKSRWR